MNPVRGTQDYLPKETAIREKIRAEILSTYKDFGFLQIKTPILENLDLLSGSEGGDNLRLMFKILKRGDKLEIENAKSENDLCDMGLRYDLTIPLARFYSSNIEKLPNPFKSIQIDEAFRAERPQKGRLRQFCQCDIDILGNKDISAEIEVLTVSGKALVNLGFKNFVFKINDRRLLNEIILKADFQAEEINSVCISLDKLDKIGIDGVEKELCEKKLSGNVLKLVEMLEIIQAKQIFGLRELNVSEAIVNSVETIVNSVNQLSNGRYSAEFDIKIIRGQGYYTASVFEIYIEGFNGACGGGGRYDDMIEKMCGKNVSAVGFSLGFERLCIILNNVDFIKESKLALFYEFDTEEFKIENTITQMMSSNDIEQYENSNFSGQIKNSNNIEKSKNLKDFVQSEKTNDKMQSKMLKNNSAFVQAFKKAEELSTEYNVSCLTKAKNFSAQLLKLKENGFTKFAILKNDNTFEIKDI